MFGKKKDKLNIDTNSQSMQDGIDIDFDDFGDFEESVSNNIQNEQIEVNNEPVNNKIEYAEQEQDRHVEDSIQSEEPIKDKKDRHTKKELKPKEKAPKKKSNSSNDEEQVVVEEKQDRVLYLVTDKMIPGLLTYLRECGLNVSRIFDNIDKINAVLMMQSQKVRVVILDTGTGKFLTTSIRKDLIDMLGSSDDDVKFTVFYSDSALKIDTIYELGKVGKQINWIHYMSTPAVVANLLQSNENYIMSSPEKETPRETMESALMYVGDDPGCDLAEPIVIRGIDPKTMEEKMFAEGTNQLQGFEPHV